MKRVKNLFLLAGACCRRSRQWLLVFMVATAVFFLVNGLVYHFTGLYEKSSSEDTIVLVSQYLKNGGLKDLMSDGQYDATYLLAELNNTQPEDMFNYFRPVAIVVEDKSGQVLFSDLETGMLAGKYVLTSMALFSFLDDEKIAEAVKNGEVNVSMRLMADIRQDDSWKFENLDLYYAGQNVAILQRQPPMLFSDETTFPFRLGRLEDINLGGRENVTYGIGSTPFEDGVMLRAYGGSTELVGPDGTALIVRSPVVQSDFGGPVFVLRDGELELLGLVEFGDGSEALVRSMQAILDEVSGFDINLQFAK